MHRVAKAKAARTNAKPEALKTAEIETLEIVWLIAPKRSNSPEH
jgi:hypothetical protein